MAIGGGILGVIGLILFIISLAVVPGVVKRVGDNAVKDGIVVSSPSSSYYENWSGQSSRKNYYLQYYYAYNLTNAADVLAGGKPIYNQVGPFNYRYYWDYLNVSFPDNGNQATYSQRKFYEFDSETSKLPEDTLITNINPAFIGLMQQTKDSTSFLMVGTFPTINMFMPYLNSVYFKTLALSYNVIPIFNNQLKSLIADVTIDAFYSSWANDTTLPTTSTHWAGMIIGANPPTGITVEAAKLIFDATSGLSILNYTVGLPLWYNASFGEATATQQLTTGLGITPAQMNSVIGWWMNGTNSYSLNATTPLLTSCNATSMADPMLGFCQLYNRLALNGTSISQFNIINNIFNPTQGAPEILGLSEPIQKLYAYFFLPYFGPYNLNNINGGAALAALAMEDPRGVNIWGMDNTTVAALGNWMFTLGNSKGYFAAYGRQIMTNGGGLIATKTVGDWLWNCNDPMLNYLQAGTPCALQSNYTIPPPTTINSGKNDNRLVNSLVKWQNLTELPFWASPVPVKGYVESGQFPPLQDKMETLDIFEENIFRTIQLNYFNDTNVDGIKTRRYYLQNDSFPVDPTYFTTQAGFANLTSVQDGVPAFITLWDMWEVDTSISSKVDGQNPTYENAAIPLDLEPITGNALYYNLKLQLNFLVDNTIPAWDGSWQLYNKISSNIYYPSWKIGQTAMPSSDSINQLKSQLKTLRALNIVPEVVLALVGGLMFLGGVIMGSIGYIRYRRGYSGLNEAVPLL
ncbi:hypothetical protein SAMD00019534_052140 [Acytostelium subglobosum LB1]|uniref:hypothetical protein n=1 Tax=Acytostelium subglobosum LB1 TaxID=1410327 RepID=UPI000644C190|nr:hypothetical protein SAMD00019534_052140 [Acytostelium subglobosum LB1]GAM22039.1 hypothetical protein SAMD00019534_052140 [Acytostelium subglobosum LB1]|eukprot:XP_012755139.1 hypothetical protein SAMD00019534_052140 [Acytostelium subglobosum LB1]